MNPFSTIGNTSLMKFALNEHERDDLTSFLQTLVRTPSLSTREGAVAELITERLQEVGVEDVTTDPAGNVIARLGTGDGPTVLFDAHMDTVAPTDGSWPYPAYAAEIADGYLYGIGACDMKGSIAAMVYAAKRLIEAEAELNGSLVMAFVVQEEPCEGGALKVIVEEGSIQPDYVVLGEPSNMQVMLGHRGRVMFKVTVHGRSSHASNPALGDNAITAAARLIFGIEMLDMGSDPVMGPGTVTVTHIESRAASLNAVPDRCVFYVDRRLTLGETAQRAQGQLESIIQTESITADIEILTYEADTYTGYPLRTTEAFDAWAIDRDHALVKATKQAVKAVRRDEAVLSHWPFSTDGVYSMGEASIPSVGFGPGDPTLAHTAQERVNLQDVMQAAQIYAVLSAMLLG